MLSFLATVLEMHTLAQLGPPLGCDSAWNSEEGTVAGRRSLA